MELNTFNSTLVSQFLLSSHFIQDFSFCLDNEDNNWKENQCFFRDRVLLFDLSVDPGEQEDLSALMTDVVDRMQVMTFTSSRYS